MIVATRRVFLKAAPLAPHSKERVRSRVFLVPLGEQTFWSAAPKAPLWKTLDLLTRARTAKRKVAWPRLPCAPRFFESGAFGAALQRASPFAVFFGSTRRANFLECGAEGAALEDAGLASAGSNGRAESGMATVALRAEVF
jgi:hypothetical protein